MLFLNLNTFITSVLKFFLIFSPKLKPDSMPFERTKSMEGTLKNSKVSGIEVHLLWQIDMEASIDALHVFLSRVVLVHAVSASFLHSSSVVALLVFLSPIGYPSFTFNWWGVYI